MSKMLLIPLEEAMRQYRLRSIIALVGIIALSIWAGMQIERVRPTPLGVYTVRRPVKATNTYTSMRPVSRVTSGRSD
jgi:hypothetical protein